MRGIKINPQKQKPQRERRGFYKFSGGPRRDRQEPSTYDPDLDCRFKRHWHTSNYSQESLQQELDLGLVSEVNISLAAIRPTFINHSSGTVS